LIGDRRVDFIVQDGPTVLCHLSVMFVFHIPSVRGG
jgi:hypothetical protein